MWKPYSFIEAWIYDGCPINFEGYPIAKGDFIVFKQVGADVPHYARIHSIDVVTEYCLNLEWYDEQHRVRLTRFSPNTIQSIEVRESLDEARASATAARRTYAEQTPRGESCAE